MRRAQLLILIFSLQFFAGCQWLSQESQPTPVVRKNDATQIVDRQRLQKGGKIVIAAFSAGPDVEASNLLDQVSLSLVKGVSDILANEANTFEILTAEQAQEADFIIEGHVIKLNRSSKLARLLLRRKKVSVAVKGKMRDVVTGEPVLLFKEKQDAVSPESDYRGPAVQLGEQIGRLIVDGAKK